MGKGGYRPGAGRKRTKLGISPDVARAALGRLHEPQIAIADVKTPIDYVLYLLKCNDLRIMSEIFRDTMNRAYGRPVQALTLNGDIDVSLSSRKDRLAEILTVLAR